LIIFTSLTILTADFRCEKRRIVRRIAAGSAGILARWFSLR